MAYDSGLTATDIKDIFDTGLADSKITTWIDLAESKVDDLPDHDALDAARKQKITRYLTAALMTAHDPRVSRESHESASVEYGGERMTYHEIAASLDPTGNIGRTATASVDTFEVR